MLDFFKKTKVENPQITVTEFLKKPSLKALEEMKKTERESCFDIHDNLNFGMYYTGAKFPQAPEITSSNLKYSANITELKQELEKREYLKSLIEPFVKGVHELYMNVKIMYMHNLNEKVFIVLPWPEEGRMNFYNQGDYDVVGIFPKYCDPTDESTREIKERVEQLERWQNGTEKFVPLPI
jgi:hypothetical protein